MESRRRNAIESDTDSRLLVLAPQDNVAVLRETVQAGETLLIGGRPTVPPRTIIAGHKIARRAITAGDKIVKYGAPIGSATADIAVGDHVHLHNMKSDYIRTHSLEAARAEAGRRGGGVDGF